jgi:hypothetical protein
MTIWPIVSQQRPGLDANWLPVQCHRCQQRANAQELPLIAGFHLKQYVDQFDENL